jgi:Secretion system C-terminal sorting domain
MDSFFSKLPTLSFADSNFYDKVYPFADLENYSSATKPISTSYFLQAYSELERSQWLIKTKPTDFSYNDCKHFIDGSNEQLQIPLFTIQQNINFIDSNMIANKTLIDSNGYLQQYKAGNIFTSKKINMIVAGIGSHYYTNKHYKLNLYQLATVNNSNKKIIKVIIKSKVSGKKWIWTEANADDIVIDKEGMDIWYLEAYSEDGLEFSNDQNVACRMSQADINSLAGGIICADYKQVIGTGTDLTNPGYQGMYETKNYQGQGEYVIFYGRNGAADISCNKIVNKPLIISDAWDAEDNRQIYSNEINNFDWFDYNSKNGNEDIYHKHMTWTDNNQETGTPHNLVEEARDLGYDVIIVNYNKFETDFVTKTIHLTGGSTTTISVSEKTIDGGGDYIQRNAQVFQKILDEVIAELSNPLHPSSEDIVVIGPSMGGQITRYALRDYEIKNIPHRCRLWVSFDSPHLGANIPFGLQKTIETFALRLGQTEALSTMKNSFAAPAANQMIISQIAHQPFEQNCYINQQGNSPLHLAYYNEINTMGMPQFCRKIALVNGKLTGGEYHQAGSRMFHLDVFAGKHKHWLLLNNITNYATNQQPCENSVTIKYRKLLYGTAVKWKDWDYNPFYGTMGPLDAAPGGMYDVQDAFYSPIIGNIQINCNTFLGISGWNYQAGYAFIKDTTHNMCFIPSYSSLAIKSHNIDWRLPINIGQPLCNNDTPFDNFYAPSENQSHTFLSKENVAWVKQEIEKGHKGPDCSPICATNITNQRICLGVNSTVTLNQPITTYQTATWTCGPGLTKISAAQNSAMFKTNSSFSAISGANKQIKTTVYGIYPYTTANVSFVSYMPGSCFQMIDAKLSGGNFPAGTQFYWSTNGYTYTTISASSFQVVCVNTAKTVWCKIIHPCGGQQIFTYTTPVYNNASCSCKTDDNFTTKENLKIEVSPNPTQTDWVITLFNFAKTLNSSVKLYDINGKIVWQYSQGITNFSNITVPARDLVKGVYLLRIETDMQKAIYKLIKE